MKETFITWSITYIKEEELPFYVRLDEKSIWYPNETVWFLDYGRFKTYEEAIHYADTLPDPEEALKKENKVFESSN